MRPTWNILSSNCLTGNKSQSFCSNDLQHGHTEYVQGAGGSQWGQWSARARHSRRKWWRFELVWNVGRRLKAVSFGRYYKVLQCSLFKFSAAAPVHAPVHVPVHFSVHVPVHVQPSENSHELFRRRSPSDGGNAAGLLRLWLIAWSDCMFTAPGVEPQAQYMGPTRPGSMFSTCFWFQCRSTNWGHVHAPLCGHSSQ